MTTQLNRSDKHDTYYWASGRCGDRARYPWSHNDFSLPRPKNFAIPFSTVLKDAQQLSLFVDIDPEILGGTPRIDGTRIPVYMVLNAIDEYNSVQGAAHAYRSSISEEEVRDALRFAMRVMESPVEHKLANLD